MSPRPIPGTEAYEAWRRAPADAVRARKEAERAEAIRIAVLNAPEIVRQRHIADRILAEVKANSRFGAEVVLGLGRSRALVIVRQEVFYRLRSETRLSVGEIARRMHRSKATVIHGIRAHARRRGLSDPQSVNPHDAASARANLSEP